MNSLAKWYPSTDASGHRKGVACVGGPPIFSPRRPIGRILLLKENPNVREVGSEIQNSSIVSDRAEILEEFDSEAEMSDHAPPHKHNNNDAPNTTPSSPVSEAKRQSTASLDNGRLESPRLSERRGKGRLRLFVVNEDGTSIPSVDSRFFQEQLLLKLSPGSTQGSTCSTPLPQYTQCTEDPILARTSSTNRRASLWDIKQRLVLSYVSEQQTRLLHHPPSIQGKESPSSQVSEPPPYLSDREPNRRADEDLNCSSATVQTQARQVPPLANAQRLRPLILPTQLAKRDVTVPVDHAKQRSLRPLLLPQDIEERNKHEVLARPTFKPTTIIPASISACAVGGLGGPNQIEEVLRLLDKNGLSHSAPKLVQSAMLRQDVLQSFESLASTYGTTPNDSLANISSQARDMLLLPPMPESGSDWEVQIIGRYCISSVVYL